MSELCLKVKDYFIKRGIQFEEEDFEEVYEEIQKREGYLFEKANFTYPVHKKPAYAVIKKSQNKKDKEVKVKSKTVFGILKCVAGGLMCIIPVPGVQAVGAGLILNGINDCVDEARDQGDENERLQQMDAQRRREAGNESHSLL